MRKYIVLIMMIFGCQGNDISNSSKIFIDLDDTESVDITVRFVPPISV